MINYIDDLKKMVGKPVPESIIKEVDWNYYNMLTEEDRNHKLLLLAGVIRRRIDGSNGSLLLG